MTGRDEVRDLLLVARQTRLDTLDRDLLRGQRRIDIAAREFGDGDPAVVAQRRGLGERCGAKNEEGRAPVLVAPADGAALQIVLQRELGAMCFEQGAGPPPMRQQRLVRNADRPALRLRIGVGDDQPCLLQRGDHAEARRGQERLVGRELGGHHDVGITAAAGQVEDHIVHSGVDLMIGIKRHHGPVGPGADRVFKTANALVARIADRAGFGRVVVIEKLEGKLQQRQAVLLPPRSVGEHVGQRQIVLVVADEPDAGERRRRADDLVQRAGARPPQPVEAFVAREIGQHRAVLEQRDQVRAQRRDHPDEPRARQPRERRSEGVALPRGVRARRLSRPEQQLLQLVDEQRQPQPAGGALLRQARGDCVGGTGRIVTHTESQRGRIDRQIRKCRGNGGCKGGQRRPLAAARQDDCRAPAVVRARRLLQIGEQTGARKRGFAHAAAAVDEQESTAGEVLATQQLQRLLSRLAAAAEDTAMPDVEHVEPTERRSAPGIREPRAAWPDAQVEPAEQVLDLPDRMDLRARPLQAFDLWRHLGDVAFGEGDDHPATVGDRAAQPVVRQEAVQLVLDEPDFADRQRGVEPPGRHQDGCSAVVPGVLCGPLREPVGALQRVRDERGELPAVADMDLAGQIEAETALLIERRNARDPLAHEIVIARRDRQRVTASPDIGPRFPQRHRRNAFDSNRSGGRCNRYRHRRRHGATAAGTRLRRTDRAATRRAPPLPRRRGP